VRSDRGVRAVPDRRAHREGLDAARARGRTGGRPVKLTDAKLATACRLYDERAHTVAQIVKIVGVSRSTLYRHLEPEDAAKAADAS